MGRQVVLDQVEPGLPGIAGAQPFPSGQDVPTGFAFVNGAGEGVAMKIVEGQQLLGPLGAPVSSPQPLGMAFSGPAISRQGFDLHRAEFVEADDGSVAGPLLVKFQNAVFFDSKWGSGDSFQVLVLWKLRPSRRSRRRTHSSEKAGSNLWR